MAKSKGGGLSFEEALAAAGLAKELLAGGGSPSVQEEAKKLLDAALTVLNIKAGG